MPKTVGDLASIFKVSPQTIRLWCSTFEGFLSPNATPGTGQTRVFDDDDLAVLTLVAVMREQEKASYDDIRHALERGQRATLEEADPESQPEPEEPTEPVGTALVSRLRADLARIEGKLEAAEGERHRLLEERRELQDRLDREQATRLEVEKQAVRLEEQLKSLREQLAAEQEAAVWRARLEAMQEREQERRAEVLHEPADAPAREANSVAKAETHPERPSWWQRLLGRR